MTLRFNGFSMIHKALRAMLYDAGLQLQQVNFADPAAASAVFSKVKMILEMYDDHADHEDAHILPMIDSHDKALQDSFEKEHVTDRRLAAELNTAMQAYESAATPPERIMAGNKVFYAFNSFIAFNLEHMNREETELNTVLWANYQDQDIMAVSQKIAASVPPAKLFETARWMMRGCSDMELGMYLKIAGKGMPADKLELLMELASKELPVERFERIRAMAEEQVPA